MMNGCFSPKRGTIIGRTVKEVSVGLEKIRELPIQLKLNSPKKHTTKLIRKSSKTDISPKLSEVSVRKKGKVFFPLSSRSPPHPQAEALNISLKTQGHCSSLSPEKSITSLLQTSLENLRAIERSTLDFKKNKFKNSNIKKLKTTIFDTLLKKKNEVKNSNLTRIFSSYGSDGKLMSPRAKLKKTRREYTCIYELKQHKNKNKNKKPLVLRKKKGKKTKEPKEPIGKYQDQESFRSKKQEVSKRLRDLNKRIKNLKNQANYSYQDTIKAVEKAAIKIQSHIRGYLVRKIFSKYFKSFRKPQKPTTPDYTKQLEIKIENKIKSAQLKQLEILKEIEVKETKDLLKSYNDTSDIKKKLKDIINRRYTILSQTILDPNFQIGNEKKLKKQIFIDERFKRPGDKAAGGIGFVNKDQGRIGEDIVELIDNIRESPYKSLSSTPKSTRNSESPEKMTKMVEIVHQHRGTPEVNMLSPVFSPKNQPVIDNSEDKQPVKAIFLSIVRVQLLKNTESQKIIIERSIFEAECYVYNILLNEILLEPSFYPNEKNAINACIPIRFMGPNLSDHFATDKNVLNNFFNNFLHSNPKEKLMKKLRKTWSPKKILSNLEDLALRSYKKLSYFQDSPWKNIYKEHPESIQKIYNKLQNEVINEAISRYASKNAILPWLSYTEKLISLDYDSLIINTKKTLESWIDIEGGKIPDMSMVNLFGHLNEDMLQLYREKNLEKIMENDILEENEELVDLKYQETELLLEIEGKIFLELIWETYCLVDI